MKKVAFAILIMLLVTLFWVRTWGISMIPNETLVAVSKQSWIDNADKSLIAHSLYLRWSGSIARDLWQQTIDPTKNSENNRFALHNIGNTYVDEAQSQKQIDTQISLLLDAKASYESALKNGSDAETESNLEAVIKILEKLQAKQEEQKKEASQDSKSDANTPSWTTGSGATSATGSTDSQNQGNKTSSGSNDAAASSSGSQSATGSASIPKNNGSLFTNQGKTESTGRDFGSGTWESLNPDEKNKIESILRDIDQLQKQRSDYTRPDGTKAPTTGGLFEQFLKSDPLFEDLQNGGSGKRDW